MFGKSGGSVKGNSMDPFSMMMMSQMMNRSQPVTQLPPGMHPGAEVPAVLTGEQVLGRGLGMEKTLDKQGLSITKTNPLFADNAPQEYRDKYFDYAYKPLLDGAAIGQYLKGNLNGAGGNTVAGSFLSNTALEGRKQAFFEGENWRNMQANLLFNRRNQLFGQNNALIAQQNALDVQRGLGITDATTARLGMLNQFQLGTQGNFASAMNAGMGRNLEAGMFNAQMQAQQDAARMGNIGNLAGGIMGIGGGLMNGMMGRRSAGGGIMSSGGGGSMFTVPAISSNFFKQSNF